MRKNLLSLVTIIMVVNIVALPIFSVAKAQDLGDLNNETTVIEEPLTVETNEPVTEITVVEEAVTEPTPSLTVETHEPAVLMFNNQGPAVMITSPSDGSRFDEPGSFTITAEAVDVDSYVVVVEFYAGSTFLGSDNDLPYSIDVSNLDDGTYWLTAKAYDNLGASTNSEVVIIHVDPTTPNEPPVVSITSPTDKASFTDPSEIVIESEATDADGIVQVDFYSGFTKIGQANSEPFNYTWTDLYAGTYWLSAVAYDAKGNYTTSEPVVITIESSVINEPPVINIINPSNNENFNDPAQIIIRAEATDTDGIAKVDFYNGTNYLGSATSAPFDFIWDELYAGKYWLAAIAYDSKGAMATSDATIITINSSIVNEPPAVTITSPANGETLVDPTEVIIEVEATDADGVVQVDFYNGANYIGSSTSAPFTFTWDELYAGKYWLAAVAYDSKGAMATSPATVITINSSIVNEPPMVAITSPKNNLISTDPTQIVIKANATDDDGISQVDFYNGANYLGSATSAPFNYTWTELYAGNYWLAAVAYDTKGGMATSSAIKITIKSNIVNEPPVVVITSPTAGQTFTDPSEIILEATATDADGVTQVTFYNGAVEIGTVTSEPYSVNWDTLTPGKYWLAAIAYDSKGGVAVSDTVVVTITSTTPNQLPVVALTKPTNEQVFDNPESVELFAATNDTDGSVVQVNFYVDSILLATDDQAPFVYDWTQLYAGEYELIAVAIDNQGGIASSLPVNITINSTNTNLAPEVIITAPINGSVLEDPDFIDIDVTATDDDGTISRVDFYAGPVLLGSDDSAPYSFKWENYAPGTYSLTAVATDNMGKLGTSDPIEIELVEPVVE